MGLVLGRRIDLLKGLFLSLNFRDGSGVHSDVSLRANEISFTTCNSDAIIDVNERVLALTVRRITVDSFKQADQVLWINRT